MLWWCMLLISALGRQRPARSTEEKSSLAGKRFHVLITSIAHCTWYTLVDNDLKITLAVLANSVSKMSLNVYFLV